MGLSKEHREFHEHLDKCDQCRLQPANLCKDGSTLLSKAADSYRNENRANIEKAAASLTGKKNA